MATIASTATLAHAQQKLAPLEPEQLNVVELPENFPLHWVWINDVSFTHISDGRAYLVDGDTGRFIGMISGGLAHGSLQLAPDGKTFSVPGTYLARGTRGERTDVVTFYDAQTLKPGKEVVIPPKKMLSMPFLNASPLSDDGRFSLIYNFTPEQSVTVVDVKGESLVGEFPTSGCALMYPTGPRTFMMLCGDGSLQNMNLSEDGQVEPLAMSPRVFTDNDPATEKAVRISKTQWLFFTYSSTAHVIDGSGKAPVEKRRWSLIPPEDKGWAIGGLQPAAYHAPSNRLYTLMHEGGAFTHKQPGTEIWIYDLGTNKRVSRVKLDAPASAIAISGDSAPLLYTIMFGVPELRILDPVSGKTMRTVTDLSDEMSLLQPSPAPAEKTGS
jgi:methylamine dehydrogenase heavy chain